MSNEPELASEIDRRAALKVIATTPMLATLVWNEPEIAEAQRKAGAALASGVVFAPKFFTPAQWQTVRVLSDMIVPRDERSGSATDVGVPEFIDFMMIDQPGHQPRMRDALAWFDDQAHARFGVAFADATFSQRAAILNDVAWPAHAAASKKDGVAYFVFFRSFVLTGFWTSKVGIGDLQYNGNTFVPHWDGCPPAALKKLGVSYNE